MNVHIASQRFDSPEMNAPGEAASKGSTTAAARGGTTAGIIPMLLAVLFSATTVFASGGGPSVTVVGQPLQVEGVVVTLDDSVREPYLVRKFAMISQPNDSTAMSFDVPLGKRLIVESIAVGVSGAALGENVVATIVTRSSDDSTFSAVLALQPQGAFPLNTQRFAGTHPIKLRVDGTSTGDALRVLFERSVSSGFTSVSASVAGYLVDI